MKKSLILLVIGLLVGASIGYFYHGHKYWLQLEAGRNWEAGQYLDTVVHTDITDKVQITCNLGSKRSISAKEANADFAKESFIDSFLKVFGLAKEKAVLQFTDKDFDVDGKFIGHDKNFLIQRACNISKAETNELFKQNEQGKNTPSLFDVNLDRQNSQGDPLGLFGKPNPELDECLKKVNPADPLGLKSETEAQKIQREECINKYKK